MEDEADDRCALLEGIFIVLLSLDIVIDSVFILQAAFCLIFSLDFAACIFLVVSCECAQVERDFEAIHDNEELGMIDYSVICPTPPAIGAVVIVDPFSSGNHTVQ